jgi:hypothetical protein
MPDICTKSNPPRSMVAKRAMLRNAAFEAKTGKFPCTITLEDIILPTHCPVLGIPITLKSGKHNGTPVLDRIVPQLGYAKENIIVISHRARSLKKRGTPAELSAVAEFFAPAK